MKKPFTSRLTCRYAALLAAAAACLTSADAQINLTNGLISYWPLSSINNGASTSDVQGGLDLTPRSGSSIVTFAAAGITLNSSGGTRGTNGYLTLGANGLLGYQSPENSWGTPSTPLPPTQFPNWTISLWVKGSLASMPAGGGDRIFACGYSQSTSPVLDINTGGTGGASTETTSSLDNFVRQYGSTETKNSFGTIFANYTGGSHTEIVANPWDGTWHNITLTAQTITNTTPPVIQGPFTAPTNGSLTVTFTSIALDSLSASNTGSPFITTNAQGQLVGNEQTQVNTNQQYILQVSTNLNGPWTSIVSNATDGVGFTSMTDPNATNKVAFYRVIQPAIRVQNWSFYLDGNFVSDSLQYYSGANPLAVGGAVPGDVETPIGVPLPEVANNVFASYVQNTGNMPGGSDPGAIQPPLGIWQCDQFSIGGLFRTSAGSYLPSGTAIDEAAVWKRALSSAEIKNYMANGITNPAGSIPLTATLTGDFPAVAVGDVQNLNWNAAKNATSFVLNPGNINVAGDTVSGIGTYSETITTNITNTLVVTRAAVNVTSDAVATIAVPGVAAGWHYIDSFTYLPDGWINGQGGWINPPAGVYSDLLEDEVYTAPDGNNFVSFDGDVAGAAGNGGLSGRHLNGDSIPVNGYGTLFFRFYLDPELNDPDNNNLGGAYPNVDCNVGITDQSLRDPIDFDGLNGGVGPGIFIVLNAGGVGGPIDLQASDGPGEMALSPGGYSWVADTYNNPNGNGLDVGAVYDTWIDFTNGPAEVAGGLGSGGTQTNGAYYRVWLQEVAGPNVMANRINLFSAITPTTTQTSQTFPQGFLVSGRDMSSNNVAQFPSELLGNLFMCTSKTISDEDTNMLRFDDFYLSTSQYNSTLPTPNPPVAAFGPSPANE